MIYRRFLDISGRQIHYRESDNLAGGVPLVMLHLLPGSSLQLGPLMQDLSPRYALAPDIAGAGDSDPLDLDQPSIADLAADMLALIEARCGNKPVDLYGTHTGACVAIELAASHPDLVRSVIIDGVPIFDASTAAKFAETYAPVIKPDHDGTHFLKAHSFCKDLSLFFPWYDKSAKAARCRGLSHPDTLFAFVMEVLKGIDTIPALYRAAFSYPTVERLRDVLQPTLCLAPAGDTLAQPTRQALNLLSSGQLVEVEGNESDRSSSAAAINAFLENKAA